MPTFTLTYADHDEAAATIELTIEARDERLAMGQAHEILTAEPRSERLGAPIDHRSGGGIVTLTFSIVMLLVLAALVYFNNEPKGPRPA